MRLQTISKFAVAIAMLVGLGMIALGGLFMALGFDAKSDIRAALAKERIVTSSDAPIPGVEVVDARTAKAQQDAIEAHTFGRWGPYSELDREDPRRETYITGLTLRNSLNLAVVGFGMADMAVGIGGVTIVLGTIIAGLALPVHLLVLRLGRLESRLGDM
ncbi:MAG: hypothetical protein HYX93_06120 [Chloroflexi bacterium]|nr:hypothetical protein [Chloroflexota bacterium]